MTLIDLPATRSYRGDQPDRPIGEEHQAVPIRRRKLPWRTHSSREEWARRAEHVKKAYFLKLAPASREARKKGE